MLGTGCIIELPSSIRYVHSSPPCISLFIVTHLSYFHTYRASKAPIRKNSKLVNREPRTENRRELFKKGYRISTLSTIRSNQSLKWRILAKRFSYVDTSSRFEFKMEQTLKNFNNVRRHQPRWELWKRVDIFSTIFRRRVCWSDESIEWTFSNRIRMVYHLSNKLARYRLSAFLEYATSHYAYHLLQFHSQCLRMRVPAIVFFSKR